MTPLASETPGECQPKFTRFPAEIHGKRQPKFTRNMNMIASTRPACSCNSDSIGWEDTEQKPAYVYPIPQQNLVVQPASPSLRPPANLGNSDSSGRRGPRLNTSQSLPDSQEKHDPAHLPACETPGECQLKFNGSSGRNMIISGRRDFCRKLANICLLRPRYSCQAQVGTLELCFFVKNRLSHGETPKR